MRVYVEGPIRLSCLLFLTIGLFQVASIPVICALLIKIVK